MSLLLAVLGQFVPGLATAPLLADSARLSLLVTDSDSFMVHRAAGSLELPDGLEAGAYTLGDLTGSEQKAAAFADSRLVVVDVMDDNLAEYVRAAGLPGKARVLALRGSKDDKALALQGFEFNEEVAAYFDHLGAENVRRMIVRAFALEIAPDLPYEPPLVQLDDGLYHPAAPATFATVEEYMSWLEARDGYDASRPRLGIMFFSTYLIEGQIESLDALIDRLEAAGFNVYPAFGTDATVLENFFLDQNDVARIDALLSFGLKFYVSYNEKIKRLLGKLDVPVFNGLKLYSQTLDEWRADDRGVASLDVVWNLDNPEVSGAIEPSVLMAKVEETMPDGAVTYRYALVDEQVDHLIPRVKNWISLRRKDNADKKIAVLYYNNSRGKQNVGASYLNVFRSIEELAKNLTGAGYSVKTDGDAPLTEEVVKDLVLRGGRNVGSWAPGELEELAGTGLAEMLDVSEYKAWFEELPSEFKEKVVAQWGRPEDGGPMITGGKIVIPMVSLGNVVFLPEPARGEADDPMKLYHDLTMQPHHQYIAVYLWLRHKFNADAVVHLGTHGTHEWLPGKQSGLSVVCPPEVLGTDIPSVYPYIMDNIGEGLQAKRRGRAVVVDHLVPLLVKSGLAPDYEELKRTLASYDQALRVEASTAPGYLEDIGRMTADLGLHEDLKSSFTTEEEIAGLGQYLEYLETASVPYGLHTLGVSPGAEEAAEMVAAILEGGGGGKSAGQIRDDLAASGPAERDAVLRALSGHYVEPGEGNDPVRNQAAIPTGRNFYGLSPAYMPTKAAWTLGRAAADQIVQNYMDERGEYPDKVAVVLWAVESLRNEGLNESTILSLIGVEPVWNENGRVMGSRPIPMSRLGRPRVDVMVDISGLYRDLFPDKVLFVDQAFRQAAAQDDLDNFVRQNDEKNYRSLIAAGLSEEEASRFSKARIFSEAPGAYGNRVSELVSASGLWEDRSAISDVFKTHTAFAYGGDFWGAPAREALDLNLTGAKVAWHSVSSHLYGALDNDDVFMYLGGLSAAVESVSEAAPEIFLADQRRAGLVEMTPVDRFLWQESRTRYLNPKWIEGMKAEGYAGAAEMAHYVEYLWGWQVTAPDEISQDMWDETYDVYVSDKYDMDIPEYMDEANPWAFQSLTGRMLESVRKGFWQPSEEVRAELAKDYAVSVIMRGVACCDHTCNNPQFHQMVLNMISLPGVMSPQMVTDFKLAVEKAGLATLEDMVARREAVLETLSEAPGRPGQPEPQRQPAASGPEEAESELESVRGLKMETVSQDEETSLPSSGVEWTASVFVLAVVALLFLGLRRRKKGPGGT
ncbi:MAG: cobaltochelatase subunit CobN [Deltaproteobacteria bacterium]|nr:cobaltochelatase subunit CobN [Deltaproteobacteria bacterium]